MPRLPKGSEPSMSPRAIEARAKRAAKKDQKAQVSALPRSTDPIGVQAPDPIEDTTPSQADRYICANCGGANVFGLETCSTCDVGLNWSGIN